MRGLVDLVPADEVIGDGGQVLLLAGLLGIGPVVDAGGDDSERGVGGL